MTTTTTTTEEKALALLGYGSGPEHVAAACGVEVSTISKLLSDSNFATKVSELRYQNLSKYNARDTKLDSLEDILIEKLEIGVEMVANPMNVAKLLATVNAAKRRGASAPEMLAGNQQVVTLVMPTTILQKFSVNIHNQVTQAGNQELVTIPSASLIDSVKAKMKEATLNHGHEYPILTVHPTAIAGAGAD